MIIDNGKGCLLMVHDVTLMMALAPMMAMSWCCGTQQVPSEVQPWKLRKAPQFQELKQQITQRLENFFTGKHVDLEASVLETIAGQNPGSTWSMLNFSQRMSRPCWVVTTIFWDTDDDLTGG